MNDEHKIYWIWLQQVLKYGSKKVAQINETYKSAKALYDDSDYSRKISGIFNVKEIQEMNKIKLTDAKKIYDKCRESGYKIVTYGDLEYPEKLKNIPNPPCVLYVSGILPNLNDNICVSIVGTRKATLYGTNTAYELSHDLADLGAIVISGGAIGIDAAAHKGALQGNGKTVAVLACGINYDYLRTNASLRNAISRKGALITEYPPDYPVYSSNFIIRNRIVSGLSCCTVVVEAGERSGSLITANLALDQNRDVFVTPPSNIRSCVSKGVLNLLNDGAKVVTKAEDIVNEYKVLKEKESLNATFKIRKIKSSLIDKAKRENEIQDDSCKVEQEEIDNVKEDLLTGLSDNANKVYSMLKTRKYHIDEISLNLDIPIKDLLPVITELEIYGLIKSSSGRMYEKN